MSGVALLLLPLALLGGAAMLGVGIPFGLWGALLATGLIGGAMMLFGSGLGVMIAAAAIVIAPFVLVRTLPALAGRATATRDPSAAAVRRFPGDTRGYWTDSDKREAAIGPALYDPVSNPYGNPLVFDYDRAVRSPRPTAVLAKPGDDTLERMYWPVGVTPEGFYFHTVPDPTLIGYLPFGTPGACFDQ